MKTRFNTYDIICSVTELQRCIGMRVNQVYDIDNKNYLIRLQRSEEKSILLLESGNRFHTTAFEWPKNNAPSGFSMKLRKHLKNKRLEKLSQLGFDRIVDFQFGTGEAAYHVILELYDRGNIILTDYNWIILNVLRPHVEGEAIRFAVKEKYPLDRAKERTEPPSSDRLQELITSAKPGDNLKKILNPHVEFGPAVIDHVLSKVGLAGTLKPSTDPNAKGFFLERDLPLLVKAVQMADEMMTLASKNVSKGYIIQKKEERAKTKDVEASFLLTNQEFHPFLYAQHELQPNAEFATFDQAVDEFYSTLEGQKIDIKALQIEKEAMKKLHNVKKDHDKRLTELSKGQITDRNKAELITRNQTLVDNAIFAVQSAVANQLSWDEIHELVKSAQANKDPIAMCIKQLKLQSNTISLALQDPYVSSDNSEDEDDKDNRTTENVLKPMVIDVDLSLSAFGNARRYFDQKRSAAKKQQKTIESQTKAMKSAEKKTMQTLKEVQTITNINKARKVYWFEKFYWFISSENYLVIGGRDQQQNELLVKRYMRPTDIYVHADLSGASSIVIKNPSGEPVPPKTLNEAGQMAISYSIAWEAKVVTSAWWVHAPQVSKSAPTGEYITTGSFMIRGKKNFLPPCHLVLGLTFMFRLEDGSIERHLNERRVLQQDEMSVVPSEEANEEEEIVLSADEVDEDEEQADKKQDITNTLDVITEETEKVQLNNDRRKSDSHDEDNEGDSETESDDENDGAKFPDTHIKVEHDTGKIIMRTNSRTLSTSTVDYNEDRDGVVFLGDDKPVAFPSLPQKKQKNNKKSINQQQGSKTKGVVDPVVQDEKAGGERQQGLKRRQKSKLKKIKEKYKDQDDEDRAIVMEMFKPDGPKKEPKKSGKKGSHGQTQQAKKKEPFKAKLERKEGEESKADGVPTTKEQAESDEEGEAEPDQNLAAAETDMLCQLTGQPLAEDELLFAVPVVAPYTALHNYKFKVKLTPGTGRRGKASKTAVAVFLRDKACTLREKDLLKAVRDENLARNLPGKVKLSAPQLQKSKKK